MIIEDNKPSVKIIQILAMENNGCWQGHVLGLGDDGVVYIDDHNDGDSGWKVYIKDQYNG